MKAFIKFKNKSKPEWCTQEYARGVFMLQQGLVNPKSQKQADYIATVERVYALDRYDKATPKAYLELYPVETSFVDDYKSFK